MTQGSQIEIYQTVDGQIEIEVQFEADTTWLNQAQMVKLFERDQSVISRHIRNALKEGEINEKSNMQKMHIANSDLSGFFSCGCYSICRNDALIFSDVMSQFSNHFPIS